MYEMELSLHSMYHLHNQTLEDVISDLVREREAVRSSGILHVNRVTGVPAGCLGIRLLSELSVGTDGRELRLREDNRGRL